MPMCRVTLCTSSSTLGALEAPTHPISRRQSRGVVVVVSGHSTPSAIKSGLTIYRALGCIPSGDNIIRSSDVIAGAEARGRAWPANCDRTRKKLTTDRNEVETVRWTSYFAECQRRRRRLQATVVVVGAEGEGVGRLSLEAVVVGYFKAQVWKSSLGCVKCGRQSEEKWRNTKEIEDDERKGRTFRQRNQSINNKWRLRKERQNGPQIEVKVANIMKIVLRRN